MQTRATLSCSGVLASIALVIGATVPSAGQTTPKNSEWRYDGGDPGTSHYAPLDQIDRQNVKDLHIVWRGKAENLGPRADFN